MSADLGDAAHFPPRDFVDFVVHYDGRAFNVHRFVLHYHSAYFRAYFQTLSGDGSSSPASAPATAQPNSSSPASDSPLSCNHPSIAHCIHLPLQTTLVEQRPVTGADFRLFLCHLYFSAHYCYPPYLPLSDVDFNDCPRVRFTFPAMSASFDWSAKSAHLRLTDAEPKQAVCNESLLALAHYLDCAELLQRCDDVLLSKKRWTYTTQWKDECLRSVQVADRYGLQQWRRACIDAIAKMMDRSALSNEHYTREKQKWSRALLLDMFEAKL